MKKGDYYSRGFTIIEVSLVLAIAGLIFLMVFVALPGLRASQRDTTRREDMMSLIDSVKKYQSNNRGALPTGENMSVTYPGNSSNRTNWAGFYYDYLGENFIDPDGEGYNLRIQKCSKTTGAACYNNSMDEVLKKHEILIVLQASCKGEMPIKIANPRKLAVVYKLEGAGIYCSNT
jgi:prepilin-type N-terminal cleavage/methylation domain-containing protein